MAYISIIELSELLQENIQGNEYLLVTNTNLESNKLKMSEFATYVTAKVADNINEDFDERLNNAVNNSKLSVFDEGIQVGTSNKINFIGATVNTFVNEDDMSIDVYIPSATLSSHFNTIDGSTNAIVQNTPYELRYISKPSFDGAPFRIGDWIPGTLQKCIKENVTYNLSEFIYVDKVSKFKVYLIQNNENIDYLEFDCNNGTFSTDNIICTISNKTKELSHFKCNLNFQFKLDNLLKGRFLIKIEYIGTSGTFTFLEDELFFDSNSSQAEISTTLSTLSKFDKFLSGVKYLGPNSSIMLNTILKNAKNLTFPLNLVDIDGSGCGVNSQNINFTDLNLQNYNYDTDIEFNKELTFLNNKFFNSNLVLKSRVNDWAKGEYKLTNFSELVDTFLDNSTRVYEDFVSETNRVKLDLQQFNSGNILSSTDLQVYNSKLVYPQIDFSNFYNNPNYSGFSGNRNYLRKFWHTNVSHSNGIFSIISNIREEDLNTKVKIEISLDNINWFNCGLEYTGGVLLNNSGCRINSDTNSLNINNKIEFTLGLNKFTNAASNWSIILKITFLDSAKDKYIDVLQITNW